MAYNIICQLTVSAIISQPPKNAIQWLQYDTHRKTKQIAYRDNNVEYNTVNFDLKTVREMLKFHQILLVPEVFYIAFLEEFVSSARFILLPSYRHLKQILNLGIIFENRDKQESISPEEARYWCLIFLSTRK